MVIFPDVTVTLLPRICTLVSESLLIFLLSASGICITVFINALMSNFRMAMLENIGVPTKSRMDFDKGFTKVVDSI